jgi:hypothetical protein
MPWRCSNGLKCWHLEKGGGEGGKYYQHEIWEFHRDVTVGWPGAPCDLELQRQPTSVARLQVPAKLLMLYCIRPSLHYLRMECPPSQHSTVLEIFIVSPDASQILFFQLAQQVGLLLIFGAVQILLKVLNRFWIQAMIKASINIWFEEINNL